MKKLILFFVTIFPTIVFSQSNPNDAPIVQRLQSEMINSFVFGRKASTSLEPINPTFFGNKSIDKITVDQLDTTGNLLNFSNYKFSYDRFCRINNINQKIPLYNLNQDWFVNWQNNQVGITLPNYITGQDSTRFLYKYNVNGNITERTRQDFTSSGVWIGDKDYGAQYSNFDQCGNYLYSTPNNPNNPPFLVNMNYSSTCLPKRKIYSFPNGTTSTRTVEETWIYSPTYNIDRYKYEFSSSSAGGGFSCTIKEYSYNSNNKLDTVWDISCQDLSKSVNYTLTWNQDGSINKIKTFRSVISFFYNSCVINSLNETLSSKIKLHPNPVNDLLNLNYTEGASIKSFQITHLTGKVLLQKEVNDKQTEIDVSSLVKGLYLLTVETTDGRRGVQKFVKN